MLVTGGTGYIGSHAVLSLLEKGFNVIVLDNLSNSIKEPLNRISRLTDALPIFINGDIRDAKLLDKIFRHHEVSAVMHFAGLKAVGESVNMPLSYYENNVSGTVSLCQAMVRAGVFKIIFSSSATVYGQPKSFPIKEDHDLGGTTNPYGDSKYMIENILSSLARADKRWSIGILRYFNPIGAHESGIIGEHPSGIPNNLLPYITQVAIGSLKELTVYGSDYKTIDGTGVRDYIHVLDLVNGHLCALKRINLSSGLHVWNLGTGCGFSVLQMITAFEDANDITIRYKLGARRPGDVAICYADTSKAERELGWKATRNLDQMMRDSWRWQSQNPKGYLP